MGGRPESRPEVEVEAEPEVRYEDPIEKRPPEPVLSDEPQDNPAGSSSDPPPGKPCPEDPFSHVDYPLRWYGGPCLKGPWGFQCEGIWVRRRRLDAALSNRCPGEHSKIWPSLPKEIQAERWNTFRDAHGEQPVIPTQE